MDSDGWTQQTHDRLGLQTQLCVVPVLTSCRHPMTSPVDGCIAKVYLQGTAEVLTPSCRVDALYVGEHRVGHKAADQEANEQGHYEEDSCTEQTHMCKHIMPVVALCPHSVATDVQAGSAVCIHNSVTNNTHSHS